VHIERKNNSILFTLGATYELPFQGMFQVHNAVVSLATIRVLKKNGWSISNDAIKRGLAKVTWPGRFEIVRKQPCVILDGAHNVEGARALSLSLKSFPTDILIFGSSEGKNSDGFLKIIAPKFKKVITTEGAFKPLSAAKLADIAKSYCADVESFSNVEEAMDRALACCDPDGTIVVSGSLYLIPGAARHLQQLSTQEK